MFVEELGLVAGGLCVRVGLVDSQRIAGMPSERMLGQPWHDRACADRSGQCLEQFAAGWLLC